MIKDKVCRIVIIVADQTGWKLVLVTNEANRAGLTKALPIVEFGALRKSGDHFFLQMHPPAINEAAQVVIASRAFLESGGSDLVRRNKSNALRSWNRARQTPQ